MAFFIILLLTFLGSMLLCAFSVSRLIPFLRAKKYGQSILEIGPSWHKSKAGTPTMGGVAFLGIIPLFSVLCCVLLGERNLIAPACVLLFALFCGGIGLFDDAVKLKNKQNQGLLPWQKLVLQIAGGAVFLYCLTRFASPPYPLTLPFFHVPLEIGFLSFFLLLFLITGCVNCANLTDGIDGLAASVAFIIGIHFATEGYLSSHYALLAIGITLAGSMLGFLFFNLHPAKIFMGDTGSLFLGALISGGAFLTKNPMTLLIYGAVYILEGVSVVLQVLIYKRTKKRLFLMAPFHHHLEKKGWSENKIVLSGVFLTVLASYLSHLA